MINSVVLVGRLTRDPELHTFQSGAVNCSFSLAVDRGRKQEGQPSADFINCVAWNKTAELMGRYLQKGRLVGVEGRIQTRNYENQQGQRVYVTEVVADRVSFLDSKNAARPADNSYAQPGYSQNSYQTNGYQGGYNANPQPTLAPQNPYAAPAGQDLAGGYDASETLDIASDDLPF